MNKRRIKKMKEQYAEAYGIDVNDINIEFEEVGDKTVIQVKMKPPTPVTFIDMTFRITSDGANFTA